MREPQDCIRTCSVLNTLRSVLRAQHAAQSRYGPASIATLQCMESLADCTTRCDIVPIC